jgi:hypothetical protein
MLIGVGYKCCMSLLRRFSTLSVVLALFHHFKIHSLESLKKFDGQHV